MTRNLFALLQRVEDAIASAPRVPVVGKALVDPDEILESIEKLLAALPEEVHQAQWVASEKERILAEANEDARRVRREAEDYVNRLIEDHRLVHEAEKQAARVVADAQREAELIKDEAAAYAGRVLAQLEQGLERVMGVVRKSRERVASSVDDQQG